MNESISFQKEFRDSVGLRNSFLLKNLEFLFSSYLLLRNRHELRKSLYRQKILKTFIQSVFEWKNNTTGFEMYWKCSMRSPRTVYVVKLTPKRGFWLLKYKNVRNIGVDTCFFLCENFSTGCPRYCFYIAHW